MVKSKAQSQRAAATRSKKRREQKSAELPRATRCVVCSKPVDRSHSCTVCKPNGRDLVGYCSSACQIKDGWIHSWFCESIRSMDKKRPSKDHYLAAFFPCEEWFPELFWLQASLNEDGELEIQHDRPNMLEYFEEFGYSSSGPSLRHRKMNTWSLDPPHTVVAATAEPKGHDHQQVADGTPITIDRKWINRSRLAFSHPGYLHCPFYPTLLYAVDQTEKDGIIRAADLNIQDLHTVIDAWVQAPCYNNPTVGSLLDCAPKPYTVPSLLLHPWFDQQHDIKITGPTQPSYSFRSTPGSLTYPIAKLFQIGIPWYIRLPPSCIPPTPDEQCRDTQLMDPLRYVLSAHEHVGVDGRTKAGVAMHMASLWPTAVIIDGRGAPIEFEYYFAAVQYLSSTQTPTEAAFRLHWEEFKSKCQETGGSIPSLSPYEAQPHPEAAAAWPQDQPSMDFWLKLAHGTSLVPDLMAQMAQTAQKAQIAKEDQPLSTWVYEKLRQSVSMLEGDDSKAAAEALMRLKAWQASEEQSGTEAEDEK